MLSANGTFSYTPDADFNGADSFVYELTDGEGGSDTATVNITIVPQNDTPTVDTPVNDIDTVDGADFTGLNAVDVSGNFSDLDGDTLDFSTSTGLPPGLAISAAGVISGTVDASASQGGPAGDGVYTVTLVATDGTPGPGDSVTETITITVTNPAPSAGNDSFTVAEDATLNGDPAPERQRSGRRLAQLHGRHAARIRYAEPQRERHLRLHPGARLQRPTQFHVPG